MKVRRLGNPRHCAIRGLMALAAIVVTTAIWAELPQRGSIEFAGCLPGRLEDTCVQGIHAFGATPGGLVVLEVGEPAQPTQTAFLPLAGCRAVDLADGLAYVATSPEAQFGQGGLHIVDVGDPEAPVLLGSCLRPEQAVDVVKVDGVAYVADSWNGLLVVDVTDPSAPLAVGFAKSPGPHRGLDYADGLVYLADQYYGLRIIDVSDPAAPVEISQYDPNGYLHAVALYGQHVLLSSGPVVYVVDVSEPALPVEVGSCTLNRSSYHIHVDGDRAYLSHYDSFSILDIVDPTAPVVIGEAPIFGRTATVVVQDDLAYVSSGFGGLSVLDCADPIAPVALGRYAMLGEVYSVDIDRDHLVLAGGQYYSEEKIAAREARFWPYSGVFTLDVGEPTRPSLLGYLPYGNAKDAKLAGDLAYVSDSSGRFGVLDLSDPASPTLVGEAALPYRSGRLDVQGQHAYVVTDLLGLWVVDVADQAAPKVIGDVAAGSVDVEVRGDLAFVTESSFGLQIVDVSVPDAPVQIGGFDPPGWTNGLAVSGTHTYLASGIQGLRVVDVGDPTEPFEVGLADTPGLAQDVVVQGRYAYVADSEAGIRVLDVLDPTDPIEIGHFLTTSSVRCLAVAGDLIAAGTEDGGVFLLRSSLPTGVESVRAAPAVLHGGRPNPFNPRTVVVFEMRTTARVELQVFDIMGRPVRMLVPGAIREQGRHEAVWDGRDESGRTVPAGAYLCRLKTDGGEAQTKLLLLK